MTKGDPNIPPPQIISKKPVIGKSYFQCYTISFLTINIISFILFIICGSISYSFMIQRNQMKNTICEIDSFYAYCVHPDNTVTLFQLPNMKILIQKYYSPPQPVDPKACSSYQLNWTVTYWNDIAQNYLNQTLSESYSDTTTIYAEYNIYSNGKMKLCYYNPDTFELTWHLPYENWKNIGIVAITFGLLMLIMILFLVFLCKCFEIE